MKSGVEPDIIQKLDQGSDCVSKNDLLTNSGLNASSSSSTAKPTDNNNLNSNQKHLIDYDRSLYGDLESLRNHGAVDPGVLGAHGD